MPIWMLILGLPFAQVTVKLYEGETHTSPLIENPMRGGTDELEEDILSFVLGPHAPTPQYTMCPSLLVDLAAAVCPF